MRGKLVRLRKRRKRISVRGTVDGVRSLVPLALSTVMVLKGWKQPSGPFWLRERTRTWSLFVVVQDGVI